MGRYSKSKQNNTLKFIIALLLLAGALVHFSGFQMLTLIAPETGTSISGLRLDTTKSVLNPGDTLGVNVYGGQNTAFPPGTPWSPIAGGCGSAYTMPCFVQYKQPAGTMRIYIDAANGSKILLLSEHVRAYAPKWKQTGACNQYGCPGTHIAGHVFDRKGYLGRIAYDGGYSWHSTDGENYYNVIIPSDEGLAVSPVLGNVNITVTFEEDFCAEYDCGVCDPHSGITPGMEVANEHPNCYGGCSFCGFSGDKINGNIVKGVDSMLLLKDKHALTINYDTGDEWMQNLSGEFIVAKAQIRVEPPRCEFDPITEVLVHEVFFSGQTIDGSKLRYSPARICANPSPSLLRADTGLAYDSYIPIQFPYYVPPSHLAEFHYVATSQDVFGVEQVPVTCTEGSWSANHEECRVTTLVRPCPPDMILTADGICIVVTPEICPPGSYWDEGIQECAFNVCGLITDTAQWIPEFRQCGEQLLFPTLCNYNMGDTYSWELDKCIYSFGEYRESWSEELKQPWKQKNDTCTDLNGIAIISDTGGSTITGECHLPPNPVIPEGTFYAQGDSKCWAVYGTSKTQLEGLVTCPEGTTFDMETGKCIVDEIQKVISFQYENITKFFIRPPELFKIVNKYMLEIILISAGGVALFILSKKRRQ